MKIIFIIKFTIFIYISSALIKVLICTLHIGYGNYLKRTLQKFSSNKSKINQLYPQIKNYCNSVKLSALPSYYNISDRLINKSNYMVLQQLINSLDEAIGIYMYRRLHCYILLPIQPNNKSVTICKTVFDAFIKLAVSVVCNIIQAMLP